LGIASFIELLRLEQQLKRIINGFEVDWASERVFAEQQTAPNYGYLFEVKGGLAPPEALPKELASMK
jgi:hypothetical protein